MKNEESKTFRRPANKYIFILLMLLLSTNMPAMQFNAKTETDTLVGLIVDQKDKAMKNISVVYPGKSGKTVQRTDKKGIFMFPNVSLSDTLTLLLPKKRIWQVPVAGMTFLKITVQDDKFSVTEAKEEIIDTGFGTEKKRNSTSGNVTISGDELRKGGQTDLMRVLPGKVSGLTVVRNENGEEKFVIRGGSTSFVTKDNSALLVVDGVVVDNLDHVDIYSVQQVTVMKDATIYGMRGSNGAIVIKTK